MFGKKFFIYLLVMLITVSPAAGDVLLNRWILNVTLSDNGAVEEIIQAELENSGSSSLDGFSFIIPASEAAIVYDFDHTSSFTGQTVTRQPVSGGIKITVNFNRSVEAGKKWNGRIGFVADGWAVKEGQDYSISIPVEAPQAIVSGQSSSIAIPENAEIRGQVSFPKSIEVTSILQTPQEKPYKKLFQNNRIVITWFTGNLRIGDVIKINGSFSEVLNKIVGTNEKLDMVSARIKQAKGQGMDVSEAEARIKNAADYLNQAEASFWKKDNAAALEFIGYANDELAKAESTLSGKAQVTETSQTTEKKAPGIGIAGVFLALLVSFAVKRKF